MAGFHQIGRCIVDHVVPDDQAFDRLVFLHIEKAAGKSLKTFLDLTFPAGVVSPHTDYTSFEQVAPDYGLSVGHIDRQYCGRVLGEFKWFTVLREPVERVASLMNYWAQVAHPASWIYRDASEVDRAAYDLARTATLEEFAASDNQKIVDQVHNLMCFRILGAVQGNSTDQEYADKAFDLLQSEALFFGLQSQLPMTLLQIPLLLDLPARDVRLPKARVNETSLARVSAHDSRIEDLPSLRADMLLYRAAEKLFHQRMLSITEIYLNRTTYQRVHDRLPTSASH
ncbi:hypothetical protein [Pseudooctadecabacter jejudonensis]|uniref:Sulfotransferase family protein n=1 Tax=Pseudooctadecabacter jejudonensis TaxID=1391910 RepID=A0A1Y5TEF1_9RHOB|nr:hypothetical protein [Pseudooctadecabacter jejudonensis]SLN62187.1 hypothetical protein PSJ8397_03298 [Pseudooctadecabacter jejudonensis]